MKKLIVGSFTFAMAIMLCTSVFAQTLDIYSFEGDEGLVDRSEPVNSGDVLNIKTTWIKQNKDNYKNDILSKGITINGDGEVSGTSAVPESGARVTINGGRYKGFYMDKSASSTMNNLDLEGFDSYVIRIGEYVEGEGGPNDVQANSNISPKLTLNDVSIYNNQGKIEVIGKNSELNIVSNAAIDDQNYTYIGNNYGFYVKDGATVNFKGNNIDLEDYTVLNNGTINNTSNLFFKNDTMYMYDESVFNNSNMLNNSGVIYVYDSVFNNKGTMINKGNVFLASGKSEGSQGSHPTYNNDGDLENKGRIAIQNTATFNNNKYIENDNAIFVYDGGTFNNNGDIDNNGGIFVAGQFENKGNINGAKEEYIYIGNPGNEEQYAIFNNDGKMVYDYGLVDTNGILNNNGTIISNGSVEDKYVTIYGELNNKGNIDAKYLWLGSGQITGGLATGRAMRQNSRKIAKAAAVEPPEHVTPILKNYSTINVSEGIGGDQGTYIYNNGTINLGGEENKEFYGELILDNGTINLMKDSLYFNNAAKHAYIDGTLNLVNDTIDDINMNSLYLKGTTDLKLDVDLTDRAGDFLNVVGLSEGENNDNEIGTTASVSSSDSGRFLINKIKILSDSEEKRTEVPIANITPQEYINLGVHRVFSLYEYKVIITSSSAEYEPINGPVIVNPSSSDPTTGDGTAGDATMGDGTTGDGTAGSDAAEQELDETGSEYGNTLVFIRKDDKYRNPEILQSKVAIAGANISQDEIFTTVFNNAGNYTFFQKQGTSAGDVEDRAAPTLWVKAFGSKEDVELEEYTTVETTYYGAIVGLDWDRQYSDNFDATYGIFASYIGGELKDTEFDNKVDQSGGYIGVRGNWYIGKLFFNGIIDYALIQNGADTAEDNVDFNSQVAGLAARVGYNFEVANKSFTIQPNFAMTGKYIMSDDYDTVVEGDKKKMEIGNITNLTFEPGLKLIKNLGRCWILTGEGRYVIENVSGDVKYDSQVLPDTSYDNFTYLGLGIEKIWGYTVLHLKGSKTFGGRDGYIINAGVEFKF